MQILYNNFVVGSTITSSTEDSNYTFDDAFNDIRLNRVGRTTSDSSQWIKFDLSSAQSIDYIVILNHNFTSGATITIQANATDSWGSPSVSEVITYSESPIVKNITLSSYRYWRLVVDDSSNPDNYIQIGNVFLTAGLTMPGMDVNKIVAKKTTSEYSKSLSGQIFPNERTLLKYGEFYFKNSSDSDKQLVAEFVDAVDIIFPFVLIIWENDLDIEPAIYCNLVELPAFSKDVVESVRWSFNIKVEECK